MATWELAATARRGFADMIESLDEQQLASESLCTGWTSKHVLAHLVAFAEISGPGLFGKMVKARFDFDKAATAMVNDRLDRSVADLAGSLRTNGTKSAPFPGFPEGLTVGDVAIHTQDVRRPLGLGSDLDEQVLRSTLDFVTTAKQAKTLLPNARPVDGVKLVATDLDWTYGDGPEITGTGEAIMMGVASRPVLDDLSGEGLAKWS